MNALSVALTARLVPGEQFSTYLSLVAPLAVVAVLATSLQLVSVKAAKLNLHLEPDIPRGDFTKSLGRAALTMATAAIPAVGLTYILLGYGEINFISTVSPFLIVIPLALLVAVASGYVLGTGRYLLWLLVPLVESFVRLVVVAVLLLASAQVSVGALGFVLVVSTATTLPLALGLAGWQTLRRLVPRSLIATTLRLGTMSVAIVAVAQQLPIVASSTLVVSSEAGAFSALAGIGVSAQALVMTLSQMHYRSQIGYGVEFGGAGGKQIVSTALRSLTVGVAAAVVVWLMGTYFIPYLYGREYEASPGVVLAVSLTQVPLTLLTFSSMSAIAIHFRNFPLVSGLPVGLALLILVMTPGQFSAQAIAVIVLCGISVIALASLISISIRLLLLREVVT